MVEAMHPHVQLATGQGDCVPTDADVMERRRAGLAIMGI